MKLTFLPDKLLSLIFSFITVIFFLPASVLAEEVIRHYQVEIHILKNGSLQIQELIKVQAENINIKRGIYRDLPTISKHYNFFRRIHDYKINYIKRNNWDEKYHTKKRKGTLRIYIGNKSKNVEKGQHTYLIDYETNRHFAFDQQKALLNFNAIPHGFSFPIDQAEFSIYFPEDFDLSDIERFDVFTGSRGSKAQNADIKKFSDHLKVTVTKPLNARQGATFYLSIPESALPYAIKNNLAGITKDNPDLFALLFLLFIGTPLLYLLWKMFGEDPLKKAVIPEYSAPEAKELNQELTPLEIGLLNKPKFSVDITPVIISLAIKGYIKIKQIDGSFNKDNFKLTRLKDADADLNKYEKLAMQEIFSMTSAGRLLSGIVDLVSGKKSKEDSYYSVVYTKDRETQGAFFSLKQKINKKVQKWLKKSYESNIRLILIVSAIFLGIAAIANIYSFSLDGLHVAHLIINLILIFVLGMFIYLIPRYTRSGIRLKEKVEGYEMYLKTAEQPYLDKSNLENITAEVFEKHLPYAVALGVADQWTDRFKSYLKTQQQSYYDDYSPDWYQTDSNSGISGNNFKASSFASSFATSSMPTSSGSGSSGGGGFSGGGSGGGGGGGW